MARYWVIAPVESDPPKLFDKIWQFDLANSVISIGWSALGDISKLNRDELLEAVVKAFPESPPATQSLTRNMLWNFYHEISPGDFVIARRGRKKLAAVGKVTGFATDSPGKNPQNSHRSYLAVEWQAQPRDKEFPSIVFPMHTLSELTREQFESFVEGSPTILSSASTNTEVEDPSEFVLEKYLEDFIVSNFATIFKGSLQIYKDAAGNIGQQYTTDVGPIDILAIESKSKSFVVIELKKGRNPSAF